MGFEDAVALANDTAVVRWTPDAHRKIVQVERHIVAITGPTLEAATGAAPD